MTASDRIGCAWILLAATACWVAIGIVVFVVAPVLRGLGL